MDKLTKLEKVALISLGAGSAFNILLFAMGMTLDEAKSGPWYIIRGVFAVVWFIAFDLTTIATVQAMRDGRRSGWAGATVACSALAAALIGLDVSIIRLPALHAANAIVLPLFMLHLASPRRTGTSDAPHITQAVQVNVAPAAPLPAPDAVPMLEVSAPILECATYRCKRCGAGVASAAHVGSSVRWGCEICKERAA